MPTTDDYLDLVLRKGCGLINGVRSDRFKDNQDVLWEEFFALCQAIRELAAEVRVEAPEKDPTRWDARKCLVIEGIAAALPWDHILKRDITHADRARRIVHTVWSDPFSVLEE